MADWLQPTREFPARARQIARQCDFFRSLLALERHFEGEDNARGQPLRMVGFDAGILHDLRSVSKSIVGLLHGIALDDGKVPPPEAPLFSSFPEYPDRSRSSPQSLDRQPCADKDHGDRLGRTRRSLFPTRPTAKSP